MFTDAAHEEVDVVLNEGFLFAEGTIGEGVGEETAVAGVVGVIGADDGVYAVFGGAHPCRMLEDMIVQELEY